MKAYRIKHVPSGMYYTPSRKLKTAGVRWGYHNSNLHKLGKVYHKKPVLKFILAACITPNSSQVTRTAETDWEIVEYDM